MLQRRRLLDFVSLAAVILAAALYAFFILLVIYIQQDPFPGFAGYVNILFVTAMYLFLFGFAWIRVYGKKENPYLSHEARLHGIGIQVKLAVYTCIAAVSFLALNFLLAFNDAERYEPTAASLFFVVCALLYYRISRRPDAWKLDGLEPAN